MIGIIPNNIWKKPLNTLQYVHAKLMHFEKNTIISKVKMLDQVAHNIRSKVIC
jgi:malate/lactate dehydrogenase